MRGVLFIATMLFAGQVTAAVVCSGVIEQIYVYPDGRIYVNNGHGVQRLCNTSGTYQGFSADACKNYYSMFLTSKAADIPLDFYYDDSLGSCSNLGHWGTPVALPYTIRS